MHVRACIDNAAPTSIENLLAPFEGDKDTLVLGVPLSHLPFELAINLMFDIAKVTWMHQKNLRRGALTED